MNDLTVSIEKQVTKKRKASLLKIEKESLEHLAWKKNKTLQKTILKADTTKKGSLKAKDFRKKLGL